MKGVLLLAAIALGCVGAGEPPPRAGEDVVRPESVAVPGSAVSPESGAVPRQAPSYLAGRYDFGRRSARYDLPGRLDEVSGLAVTVDGRLLAHDDERGRVHVVDGATGDVGKRWDLAPGSVRDDFEGVAAVGERLFLVSSRGYLYEFREGADREDVPFRVTDLGVGNACEVEGLDHDPTTDALVVACKTSVEPDHVVVLLVPLAPDAQRPAPIRVPKDGLAAHGLGSDFAPSGVVVSPGGTLVLVSARHEALLEIDREGRILAGVALSRRRHPQPEGIAFGPDGTLYLADERNGGRARLTLYAPGAAQPGGRP